MAAMSLASAGAALFGAVYCFTSAVKYPGSFMVPFMGMVCAAMVPVNLWFAFR